MGTDNVLVERNLKNMIDNIMKWLVFGILLVVAPILYYCWYRIIAKLTIDLFQYIPDILIATLSVCCNLINICSDREKRVNYFLRWISCIALGMISIGCWGLFFLIKFNSEIIIENNVAEILLFILTFIILICMFIGFIIEIYTAKMVKKELLKKGNKDE